MKLLISVIVPVYNVENYLERCVDSICCQTYRHLEIILVDDGSLDNSPNICDSLARKDHRIKVVHKFNGGLSDARNVGVANASGEYMMFIDSDDFWASSDCLGKLVTYLESYNYPDFIGFNVSYYYPSEEKYDKWDEYKFEITNDTNRDDLIFKLVQTGRFPVSACSKIINRKFYNDNNISFITGVYSEDIPWSIELFEKAKNIRIVNEYIYCYRREVNCSITKIFTSKKYIDLLDHIDRILSMLEYSTFTEKAKNAIISFCAYEFCIALGYGRLVRMNKDQRIKNYRWLLKYKLNPKVAKVSFLYKIIGFNITSYFCAYFIKMKK